MKDLSRDKELSGYSKAAVRQISNPSEPCSSLMATTHTGNITSPGMTEGDQLL